MIFTRKMKKLLIASAVIASVGIIFLLIGYFTAKGTGVSLFDQIQNEDGNYVYTYEFNGSEIKKLSLDISYSDVNIIGGAEKNVIELVNFAKDNFNFASSATTVTVKEKSVFSGLFDLNFDGFRNYINSSRMLNKTKTVNIYLTSDSVMRLIETKLYSGDVKASGIYLDADYEITLSYGSVLFDDVKTKGELNANISEGNVDIKNSEIYLHKAVLRRGYDNIENSNLTEINADIGKGYYKHKTSRDNLLSGVLKLKTDNGRVRFGGDIYENGSFSQGMEYSGSEVEQIVIEVHVKDGNIMITE